MLEVGARVAASKSGRVIHELTTKSPGRALADDQPTA
jgi:hypothetical protein